MQFFFKRSSYRTVAPSHLKKSGDVNPVVTDNYILVPKADIWEWAKEYSRWVETAETDETCRCLWRMHPDDIGTKPGHCTKCGNKKKHSLHVEESEEPDSHLFRGMRKAMVDTHPQCPVHTKEGFLSGFFDWIEKK